MPEPSGGRHGAVAWPTAAKAAREPEPADAVSILIAPTALIGSISM